MEGDTQYSFLGSIYMYASNLGYRIQLLITRIVLFDFVISVPAPSGNCTVSLFFMLLKAAWKRFSGLRFKFHLNRVSKSFYGALKL